MPAMRVEPTADPRFYAMAKRIEDLEQRNRFLEADNASLRALAHSSQETRNQEAMENVRLRAALGASRTTRALIDAELAERNLAAQHAACMRVYEQSHGGAK